MCVFVHAYAFRYICYYSEQLDVVGLEITARLNNLIT